MRHVISVLLENEAGALSRVVGLFAARGFNIESLIETSIGCTQGILQHQLAGIAAVAAEVDNIRLGAQEQPLQVGRAHSPVLFEVKRLAVLRLA